MPYGEMSEGQPGFLSELKQLFSFRTSHTSSKGIEQSGTSFGEMEKKFEAGLQKVKERVIELKEKDQKVVVEESAKLPDEVLDVSIERVHGEIRADIIAFHQRLKSGITEQQLEEASQTLRDIEQAIHQKDNPELEVRLRAVAADKIYRECLPMGWQGLSALMNRSETKWAKSDSLPPAASAADIERTMECEARSIKEAMLSSAPTRTANRIFGIVPVWNADYPSRDTSLWKNIVIQSVAYGISGYLCSIAVKTLKNEKEKARTHVMDFLDEQLSTLDSALSSKDVTAEQAQELVSKFRGVAGEAVEEIVWSHVKKVVENQFAILRG